jgi:hypothetical protein
MNSVATTFAKQPVCNATQAAHALRTSGARTPFGVRQYSGLFFHTPESKLIAMEIEYSLFYISIT